MRLICIVSLLLLVLLGACQTTPTVPESELTLSCEHDISAYFPKKAQSIKSYGGVKIWLREIAREGAASPFVKKVERWLLQGITTADKVPQKTGRHFYVEIGSSWTNSGAAYQIAFRPNGRFYILQIPEKIEHRVGYRADTLNYRLFHCPLKLAHESVGTG